MFPKARDFMHKLSQKTDISADTLFGEPTIVMAGYRELSVDRHKCILEYSEEKIVIALYGGILTVGGAALRLKRMHKDCLTVIGRIQALAIEETA